VGLAAALLLAGCAGGHETEQDGEGERAAPHGYVEGAEETAEPQARLVVADGGDGAARVLDLLTEQVSTLDPVPGIDRISGDGRFAHLSAGVSAKVIDSGSWMVDHGDHVHCYRARVGDAGTLSGAVLSAYSDPAVTALNLAVGQVSLVDRSKLEQGSVAETGVIDRERHEDVAVPFAQHVLSTSAHGVEVSDRRGEPVTTVDESCPVPRGEAVTGRGVVFGCQDGALLVAEKEGVFTGEKIPYPETVPDAERAVEFTHRPGSATLAAKAGERGVWSLDVSERAWTLLETGPVVAVNAVGAGAPLLTLTSDGVLHAYDTATGQETTRTALLAEPVGDGPAPVIHVDTSRAYVNDAAAKAIYEIDYNDELRLARTFDLDIAPEYIVETGR
jgi:hypothetical protein